jgi:predicted permease
MAQSMGGDGDLAGEYVMVTTLLSIVTIFTWILVLKNFGCM